MKKAKGISVRIPNGSLVGTARAEADKNGGNVIIKLDGEYAERILDALKNDEVVRLTLIGGIG